LVRDRASALAQALGWELTVDAFASESNSLLPRFFARYAEPQAEAEDAFAVGDWDRSKCPFCGLYQRETLYAFPPTALLNRFVAKARADGARAILVTPLAVSAPYWSKLLRASVVPNADGFLRVRRQQAAPPDSDAPGELAIFAISEPASAYVYVLKMSCYISCIRALNMHTYIQCICIAQNAYVSMCMYCMYVYVCEHMYTPKCICQYCMYCLYVYVFVHM
jgi:hypothetical protein